MHVCMLMRRRKRLIIALSFDLTILSNAILSRGKQKHSIYTAVNCLFRYVPYVLEVYINLVKLVVCFVTNLISRCQTRYQIQCYKRRKFFYLTRRCPNINGCYSQTMCDSITCSMHTYNNVTHTHTHKDIKNP